MQSDATEIPWQSLDAETLERLLAEVVTRDGTDYGAVEQTTGAKVKAALRSLQSGRAKLFWHADTQTAALVAGDQIREWQAAYRKATRDAGIDKG